jgi:hypothetical protein
MKAIGFILCFFAILGLAACSHPRKVHASSSNSVISGLEGVALTNAIVDAWVRSYPKEDFVYFVEPDLLRYQAVERKRASGYVIASSASRTNESPGIALEIREVLVKASTAEATIVTVSHWWGSMETYSLVRHRDSNWEVTARKTILVGDRVKRPDGW